MASISSVICTSIDYQIYYIHFEMTGYPCNLIGSQQCDLFPNRTIFALNRIFFSANENKTVKQNNQSDLKVFFKLTNYIAGKWKTKTPLVGKFGNFCCSSSSFIQAIKLCDFKMDVIKWQLNFGSCNFGLKSYLWFQIKLALRARSILKSRVWFLTKLHSTQFKYHY